MEITRTAIVPYTVSEMYRLVSDVESYPQFLPWCRRVQVHERNGERVRASICLAKGPISQTFGTVNRLIADRSIEMHLEHGPFRKLDGGWNFQPLGEVGSKVSFHLEFEFANRWLAATVGPVFQDMANRLVDAFSARAVEIYGKR